MSGCTCMACCEKHCICDDADWTPKEVLILRDKLGRLEYVHEEAMKMWEQEDTEIDRLRAENERLHALLLRSRDIFHRACIHSGLVIHSDLVDDIDAALAAGGE